jgi:hypothetical protein
MAVQLHRDVVDAHICLAERQGVTSTPLGVGLEKIAHGERGERRSGEQAGCGSRARVRAGLAMLAERLMAAACDRS